MLERYCLFFMEFEERESITIETSRISLVYREGDDEKKNSWTFRRTGSVHAGISPRVISSFIPFRPARLLAATDNEHLLRDFLFLAFFSFATNRSG